MIFKAGTLRTATLLSAVVASGCAPDASETKEQRSPAALADISFATNGCDSVEQDDKLARAWNLVVNLRESVPDYQAFLGCLQGAPLLETLGVVKDRPGFSVDDCRGHRAGTAWGIVLNLLRYHVSTFNCADLNNPTPTDGSMRLAQAAPDSDEVIVDVDINFLNSASDREVAAVLLHEMAHNAGFMHTAHEFPADLHRLTVPYQVQACMMSGTPNPAPADFPDMNSECAQDPNLYWETSSVPLSSIIPGWPSPAWGECTESRGPYDDSRAIPEGPVSTWSPAPSSNN